MKDITGVTKNLLTAINFLEYRKSGKRNRPYWQFLCACGETTVVRQDSFLNGRIKSCGCYQVTVQRERMTTHGGTNSDEYNCWLGMKQRCTNPNNPKYYLYGGNGVTICDRWLNSFENFVADMGKRPSLRHSVDRFPNKEGNYEPTNCRWGTFEEQNANTSRNHWIEYKGEKLIVVDWAKRLGIDARRISENILRGESMDFIVAKYSKPAT